MATGLANSTSLPQAPDSRQDHAGERIIRQQLGRAGSYVKWIEAGSQLITLLIGTLVFFLIAALIDHWVMPLGWFGRWVMLLAYLGGCGWFLATKLFPLLIRAVNPAYSARAIEEATPTLKNSLVNFLFLKQDHAGVKQSVLDALEQRAATDIGTVEVDTVIDRAPLIRMGYVLCGVMAIAAFYKIASPKDPFQTAARVVAPWADLARPSRVIIHEVKPGHDSVYLGSTVEVSADIQGVGSKDEVRLIYTSADGQVLNRVVPMKNISGGRRYTAMLPAPDDDSKPASRSSSGGLQQGVQYHIEAGDAVSSIYEIRVRLAPTIAVAKAELAFPAYTRKPAQTQETGEISALEGTRVTIHAKANQPIKKAFLELDPRPGSAAETIPLQVEGQLAQGSFVLQLKADRVTPWRESYQVRFANEQGEISEQPVLHKLQVQADLPPEVQILAPRQHRMDVPEDGELTIEVRGVDPDFYLSQLFVSGKTKDQEQFKQSFMPASDQPSQATGKFVFRPSERSLKAGTVITYQGIAVDNRRDPLSGQPQPGRAETAEYTIHIVAARKPGGENGGQGNNNQPNPNNQAAGNEQQPMNGGANNPQPPMPNGQKPEGADSPMPNEANPAEPNSGEQKKPDDKQQKKPADQPMQDGQQSGDSSGQGNSGSGQGAGGTPQSGTGGKAQESDTGKQPPMPGQQQPQNNGGQNGNEQNDPTSPDSSGGQSGNGNSQQAKPDGSQQAPNGQGGAPGASNGPGQESGNESGDQSDNGQGTGQAGGASGRSGSGANQKPEHDGDKFEEVLKHMLEQAKQKPNGNQQNGEQNNGQEVKNPNGGAQSKPDQSGQNSGEKQNGSGQPQAGKQDGANQPKPEDGPVTAEQLEKLEKMFGKDAVAKAQEQARQQAAQQQQPNGQGEPMPGQNSAGQQPMGNQSAGGQQGSPQNGEKQQPNEGKGGSPQGPPKQGDGKQPSTAQGEKKNPGAGQNSEAGAGEQSSDKTGSGTGQEQNRDKNKEMQGDGKKSESNETSGPSTSKNQSDSKGGASGDQSGGGKQGAGQSGGQQGNDSAGGSSPGDEGAGAAKEQGKGETGSKAGKGPQAAGKTGESGQQAGEGSSTRPSEKGTEAGKGDKQGKQPGDKGGNEPGGSNAGGSQIGKGSPSGGGSGGDDGKGITKKSDDVADAANEQFSKRATDLVLQHLRNQEHTPDPELAKKLQMTPQELQDFARRWNQLKKDAEADPNKARELDEAFRSLGLRDPKTKRRAGGVVNDKQRDLRDAGGRTQAPSKYRQQFDQFRKSSGQ
ncbi:hypothetical protein NA78x_004979 [Anatilimnocola sp. NA78]|uniref:hypothetical protein n=1 Tax=Anatilimnocola sp. NA78 TaxID=3415683 RepID=UPI003CE51B89